MDMNKMETNLRQLIKNEFTVFAEHMPSMSAEEISKAMLRFSSLLSSLNDKIADFEIAYNQVLSDKLEAASISVAQARIRAQTTEEYRQLREAKALKESLENMISALKYRHKSLRDELSQFTPN
jgi:predicted  nucleic acid-binding Zn-ribbon protein